MDVLASVTARYITIQHPNGGTQRWGWPAFRRAALLAPSYAKLLQQAEREAPKT